MARHRDAVRAGGDRAAGARVGPVAVPPAERRPTGSARSAGACGRRGVGSGHRARRRLRGRAPVRRLRGLPAGATPADAPALDRHRRSCWRSASCSPLPPRCSRSDCATPPSPGSSQTTPPTRPSWAASCCSTSTTRTATTTASRGWSASTPATAACPSACATARLRSSTSRTSPAPCVTAAVWRLLPAPFDDYRLLVLLATLALLPAALLFRGPLGWRLALGALLVCNPIAVRSAWFGQNDAPSLLLVVLAFALITRRRFGWAAAAIAGAILLKQFAIVAVPFLRADGAARGMEARGPRVRRRAGGGHPALPRGRPRGLLRRHRQVRRRDLQDRGLRPLSDPRPPRDHRRPRRQLSVRAAGGAHLGAADGVARARPAAHTGALGRRRRASASPSCG